MYCKTITNIIYRIVNNTDIAMTGIYFTIYPAVYKNITLYCRIKNY